MEAGNEVTPPWQDGKPAAQEYLAILLAPVKMQEAWWV
jgi:hypothetical protein